MKNPRVCTTLSKLTIGMVDELVYTAKLADSRSELIRKAVDEYLVKRSDLFCQKCRLVGKPYGNTSNSVVLKCQKCGKVWKIRMR